jgi:hypothetical protein
MAIWRGIDGINEYREPVGNEHFLEQAPKELTKSRCQHLVVRQGRRIELRQEPGGPHDRARHLVREI